MFTSQAAPDSFHPSIQEPKPWISSCGAPHLFAEAIVVFLQVLGWPATAIWFGEFGCRKNQDFKLAANGEGMSPHACFTVTLPNRASNPLVKRLTGLRRHGTRADVEVFRE